MKFLKRFNENYIPPEIYPLKIDIDGILVELGDVGFEWVFNSESEDTLDIKLSKVNNKSFNFSDIYEPIMMLNSYMRLKFKMVNIYYELIYDTYIEEYYEFETDNTDIDFNVITIRYSW